MTTFGLLVDFVCQNYNFTQENLADYWDISIELLKQWKNNRGYPKKRPQITVSEVASIIISPPSDVLAIYGTVDNIISNFILYIKSRGYIEEGLPNQIPAQEFISFLNTFLRQSPYADSHGVKGRIKNNGVEKIQTTDDTFASLYSQSINTVLHGMFLRNCQSGETILLKEGLTLIGTDRIKCHFCIEDNPLVSRIHTAVHVTPNLNLTVQDMNSANGTFINGQRIPPMTEFLVTESDTICVANTHFTVCSNSNKY